MDLCDLSASRLSRMLRNKEIRAREVTESVLARMEEREGALHAFITRTPGEALKQADAADRLFASGAPPSPLTGIPVAVKDNICTRGTLTTCGSHMLAGYAPPYDATVVARLRRAGAVFVGKTNLDAFGMGSSTEASAFGPTRNPVDGACVPGGSSGGSAAAVAAGEAVVALGSDTGGSIRLPASFCGVVGMKPTYGRVSRYGLVAYASSLEQIGPIARSVEDCALLLGALAGKDPLDATSVDLPVPDYGASLGVGGSGVRLGIPREYFVEGLDPRVEESVLTAARRLEALGATLVDVSLPHTREAISAYYILATAEASSNLARFDGVKYGYRPEGCRDLTDLYEEARTRGFGKEVKRRIMLGTYVLSAGYYDAYYLKAQKVRTLVRGDFEKAFQEVDALLAPVSPFPPFRLGEKIEDPLQMVLVDVYTVALNLAGLPGLSVPCGTVGGLPVGFQLMGRPFEEGTLLGIGHAYEEASGRAR